MDPALIAEVVDRAPDGVLLVDAGGRIAFANRQTEVLFGFAPSELIGKTIEFLVPERFRGRHIQHQAAFHARPSTRAMGSGLELTALRKDGTELPVEISLSPLPTADGMYVTAIVRDVSERKLLEDERRRSDERYRLLAEQAQDIIYRLRLVPAPPRIEYVGPAATRLTGFTPEDHYADPDLFLRMTDPAHRALLELLMSEPDAAPNPFMTQVHRRDGMVIWLEHQFSIIRGDDRLPIAIEGIARDTSARVLLEAERQRLRSETELHADRERIARDLHDGVMQALYGVGLSLMHLKARVAEPEVAAEVEEAVRALGGVISDIRAFVMNLPVEGAHDEIARQLRSLVEERQASGQSVTLDIDVDLPELDEDRRNAILQIAREALSNARRHSSATHVRVSLRKHEQGVLLEVSDDGGGFDTTADVGRDHMGLWNMRTRAVQLGAEFEVRSAPGAGTTVRLVVLAGVE